MEITVRTLLYFVLLIGILIYLQKCVGGNGGSTGGGVLKSFLSMKSSSSHPPVLGGQ